MKNKNLKIKPWVFLQNISKLLVFTLISLGINCSIFAQTGTAASPFTSLDLAANVTTAGIYYFNIGGQSFSTYVDANGYVQVAIDNGTTQGGLPQGTALTSAPRGILTPASLAVLTGIVQTRMSTSDCNIDVTTTNATIAARIRSNTMLNQGTADNAINGSWSGVNKVNAQFNGASCTTPVATTTLDQNIFHPCGNNSSFNWIQNYNASTGYHHEFWSSGESPASVNYQLWVRGNRTVAASACTCLSNPTSTSNSSICSGSSAALTGSCASGSTLKWYSDVALTTLVTSPVSPSNTTTYYGSCVDANGCKSPSSAVVITVNTPSAVTIVNPTTACSGVSTLFNATCTSGTPAWYTNAALTTSAGITNNTNFSPVASTTYYAACVLNGCQGVSSNVAVTTTPGYAVPTVYSASICSGSSTTLNATCSSGGTPVWYTAQNTSGTAYANGSSVSPTVTTTYYSVCQSGNCFGLFNGGFSDVVTVTTTPSAAPTSIAASSSAICSGSSTSLSEVGACAAGSSLNWYTDASLTTSVSTANPYSVSPTTTTTYYAACTSTNGLCKSAAKNTTVTVTTTPAGYAYPTAYSASICSGSSTTINATCYSGGTPIWYTAQNISGTAYANGSSVSPTVNTTYYPVCQTGNCAGPWAYSDAVTVTTTPSAAPTSITASSSAICSGSSTSLTVVGACAAGSSVNWYTDASLTTSVSTANPYVVSPTTTTTYYAACLSTNGLCKSAAINTIVTVTTTPAGYAYPTAYSASICSGSSTTLNATCYSGGTPVWYTAQNISGTAYANGSSVSPTMNTTYYPVCQTGNCAGPWAYSDAVTVTTTPSAAPTSITASSSAICSGSSTSLTEVGACAAGSSVNWYTDASLTTSVSTANPYVISPTTTTTYYAACLSTNGLCKSAAINTIVTVTTTPTSYAVPTTSSASICSGSSTTLNATCNSGTPVWYTAMNTSGTSYANGSSVSPTVNTTYYPVCQTGNCAGPWAYSDAVTVTTTPSVPSITASSNAICSGTTANLTSTACSSGSSLNWYSDPSFTTSLSTANPYAVSPSASTTYYAVCTSTNGLCKTSASTVITVTTTPAAPTVATPNVSKCLSSIPSTLNATCTTGTLAWYTNAAGTGTSIANGTTVTPASTTTYYAFCQNGTCLSPSATEVVTISSAPISSANIANLNFAGNVTQTTTSSTINMTGGTGTWSSAYTSQNFCLPITFNFSTPSSSGAMIGLFPTSGTQNLNSWGDGGYKLGWNTGNSVYDDSQGGAAALVGTPAGINNYQIAISAAGVVTMSMNGSVLKTYTGAPLTSYKITDSYYQASLFTNVSMTSSMCAPTLTATPATICSGASSTLSGTCTSPATISWYSDAGLTTALPSTTVSPTSTSTYYATCYDATTGCTSASSSVVVTVNAVPAAPTAVSAVATSICTPSNPSLKATCATGTLTWYTSAALTTTVAGSGAGTTASPFIPTAAPATSTTYYAACLSATTPACLSTGVADPITVNTAPTALTNSPTATATTICANGSTTLTEAGSCSTGTMTWSTTNTSTPVVGTGSSITVSPSATTTYFVNCVAGVCSLTATKSIVITVNPLPAAPTSITTTTATICSGASVNLSSATCSTANTTLFWYTDAGHTSTAITSLYTVNPTTTKTYYAACKNNTTGCISTDAGNTEVVTVNPIPTVTALSNQSACAEASVPSTALTGTPVGVTYAISGGAAIGLANASGLTSIPSFTAVNAGITATTTTVTVTPSYTNAGQTCTGTPVTYNIVVNPKPAVLSITSFTQPTCSTATGSATFSGEPAGAWTINSSPAGYNATGTGNTPTTISGLAAGTYTFTVTNAAGCSSVASSNVVINSQPTTPPQPTLSTVTQPTCSVATGSFTISNYNAAYTYTVSPNTGVNISGLSITAPAGTYTVTATLGTCTSISSANVVVNAQPPIPPAPSLTPTSTTICVGTSTNITASGCSGTVTWSPGGSTGPSLTVSPTVTGATNYTATCTVSPCSSGASGVTTITAVAPPTNPSISVNVNTVCLGSPLTLQGFNCSGTLNWFMNTTSIGSGTNLTYSTITAGANVFTANCSGAGTIVCSAPSLTSISVNVIATTPIPNISAANSTICSGQSTLLTATNCSGIVTWSNGQTGLTTTVSPTSTSTYTATCTISGCTSVNSSNLVVTVNTQPTQAILAVNSPSICSGSSASLAVTGCTGGTVTWSNGGTGTSISVNPTSNASYTATCTIVGTSPCSNAVSTIVSNVTVVSPVVAPSITVNSPSVCNGSSVALTANNCTGGNVSWSNGGTGATINVNPTSTTTYTATCTITGTNPCPNATSNATSTVTVVNPVTAPAITVNSPSVCNGSSVALTASNCTGGTVTWSNGSSGATITVSPTTNTNYTATCTVTGTNPCPDATSTAVSNVTVVNPVTAPTITVNSPNLCNGSSVALTVPDCTGGNVTWSNGSTGTTINVNPTTNTSYTATCTVLNPPCVAVTSTAIATVTVNDPTTAPTLSINSPSICYNGLGVDLTLTGCPTNGIISWDNGISANLATITVVPSSTQTYTATCTIPGAGACPTVSANKVSTVTVTTVPDAPTSLVASPASICSGASSSLSATACTTGTLTWYSDAALLSTLASTSVNPTATTTYYAACVLNTCKSPSANVVVTVTTVPDAPTSLVASPASICSGASSSLSATACTTGTLTWYSDAALSSTLASTSVNPTATTTYYAACVLNTCKSPSANVVVTVTTVPDAPTSLVASPASICSGASSSLSATACTTGTLTWYSDAALSSTLASTSVNPTATTTYYAACVLNTCKSPSANVVVTVTTVPDAPTVLVASPASICSGASSSLSATACTTGTLTWYSDAALSSTLASTSVNPTATTTYYAACVLNTCKSHSANVVVTVTTVPDAPTSLVASPASICSGASSSLSATACTTGTLTWYSDAALSSTLASTSVNPTATTTYYAACVLNTCKSPSANVVVTVTTVPDAPTSLVASPASICSGASSSLSASACTTGTLTWYSDAALSSTLASTSVNPTATTTYYAACVLNTCKSPSANVVVTVTTVPDAPTVLVASPASICSGASSSLSATACTTGTLTWYSDAALSSTLASTSVNPTATTTYYAACVLNTCKSPSANVVVTVTTVPDAPTSLVASPASICSGASSSLSASACTTGTLTWYSDAALLSTLASTSVNPTATTTYYAACVLNSCKSPSANVVVTVTTVPDAPTSLVASPASICSGASSSLTASACTTGTLTWYSDAALSSTLASTSVNPTATTTYYAACVLNTCKSPSANVVVTVTTVPDAPTSLVASPASICSGASSSLSATACTTGTLTWYSDAALLSTLASTSVNPTSTTTYYAACVLNSCKSPSANVVVTVTTVPDAPTVLVASPASICSGASSSLTASACTTGTLTWYSDAALLSTLASTSVNPTATTTYYAACVLNSCKSPSANVVVTVTTVPDAPTSLVASPASICSGASSSLTASACTTGTLTWYSDAALSSTLASTSVNPTATTTYYAACVLNTCKSPSANVVVTVTTVPDAPTSLVASPASICSGASSSLSATACTTGTLTWYSDAALLSTLASTSVNPTSTTTYYAACVLNSCKSPSANVVVTVTTVPDAPTVLVASPASICSGASSSLTASACTTGTLTWYSDAALLSTLASTSVNPTATTTYYAACVLNSCKSPSANVVVTVTTCPIATNDTGQLPPNGTVSVNVLANDTGGSTLLPSTVKITDPATGLPVSTLNVPGGHWDVQADGSIKYTQTDATKGLPAPITYTASDANGNSATATVTLSVVTAFYVTLIDFNALKEENDIKIVWTTSEEINADKFEIMRGIDAKVFEKIGTVKANGNSHNKQYYNFIDRNPFNGINYYRLKSIDFDGSVQLSNIVSVHYEPILKVIIAPNPFVDKITVNSSESIIKAVLYMPNGSQSNLTMHQMGSIIEIELVQNLSAGVYILSLENLKNQIVKYRLVKE